MSHKEQFLTERIFNLRVALRILEQGRCPFIREAKTLLKERIKEIQASPIESTKNEKST